MMVNKSGMGQLIVRYLKIQTVMNKSEVSENSIALSKIYMGDISGSKRPHIAKENDPKYMNAIRPYVKERKISKRDSHKNISASITPEVKSKPKKNDSSSRRLPDDSASASKNVGDIYSELLTLKADYKQLKNSYNSLAKQNLELTQRTEREGASVEAMRRELERAQKESEKHQSNVRFMEEEIDRIKKECFRLLESEKYQNKKLEETLQEKQLMIAYLRSQLAVLNGENPNSGFFFQHTAPTYKHEYKASSVVVSHIKTEDKPANSSHLNALSKISATHSAISSVQEESFEEINLPRQIPSGTKKQEPLVSMIKPKRQYIFSNDEDSLSFSREKSKQDQDSLMSISEPTILTFTKKDAYICDEEDGNFPDEEGTSNYTGEEELLTFENRYGGNSKIVDSLPNTSKGKATTDQKRGSKPKIRSKKLQIVTDQMGEPKDSSAQTRKKYAHRMGKAEASKPSKQKKMRSKRKSEEPTAGLKR